MGPHSLDQVARGSLLGFSDRPKNIETDLVRRKNRTPHSKAYATEGAGLMANAHIDGTNYYRPIVQYLISPADRNPIRERLGTKHTCRYCGKTGAKHFRKTAHALPQSLGNNRLISLDECDACNERFARYENDLVNFYGPVRTMLGLPNKDKAPSAADKFRKIRRSGKNISVRTSGIESIDSEVSLAITAGGRKRLKLRLPAPEYCPYRAFLALQKCAVALLAHHALPHHSKVLSVLRGELRPPEQLLRASLSLTHRGPTLFAAVLHERSDSDTACADLRLPRRVFCLYMAYTCLVVPVLDDTLLHSQTRSLDLTLDPSLMFPNGELVYRHAHVFDWSSNSPMPTPFSQASILLPD